MKITCDICSKTWPDEKNWITDFSSSTLYLYEDQFFPGYCVLVLKNHVTEIFELAAEARNAMIEELNLSAQILKEIFQARKINYALLGNYTPHIHWHVIPRLVDDPIPKETTFSYPHEKKILSEQEHAQRINLIRKRLQTK